MLHNFAKLQHCGIASVFLFLLCCAAQFARADPIPIRTYTTSDGLISNNIFSVRQDSKGYIWLATRAGVSRFDGYKFANYSSHEGLPKGPIYDFLETRSGDYWAASFGGGLCRFDASPGAHSRFGCLRLGIREGSNYVFCLYEDSRGRLWAGTSDGVFVKANESSAPFLEVVLSPKRLEFHSITQDGTGGMWLVSNGGGLFRLRANGSTLHWEAHGLLEFVKKVFTDRRGRVWCGTGRGLALLYADPSPSAPVVERLYSSSPENQNPENAFYEDLNGTIWFSNSDALVQMSSGHLTRYTTGSAQRWAASITRDIDGNLWVATNEGLLKIGDTGFFAYGKAEGLSHGVSAILQDSQNRVCVVGGLVLNLLISCESADGFRTVRPMFPRNVNYFGWGHERIVLQSRDHEWWMATGRGVMRFPAVAEIADLSRTPPKAWYTKLDGLCGNEIFRIFEDSRSNIWVSSIGKDSGVSRWDPHARRFQPNCGAFGSDNTVSAFAEDKAGEIWMGLYEGGLARYRNGEIQLFGEEDSLPAGHIGSLYVDPKGTLWAANFQNGLIQVERPEAHHPQFSRLTTADGLTSDNVQSIVADDRGRLYVGTDRGLDRIDLQTHEARHYSPGDGLAGGYTEVSFRDSLGRLWFGAHNTGLARLMPVLDVPARKRPVLIKGIRINGVLLSIDELGSPFVGPLQLLTGQNHIEIEFGAVSLKPGFIVQYRYKLDGVDKDWNPLGEQRSVSYANLAPGNYRFLADASLTGDPAETATVIFTIAYPLWQRWWFIALALTALAAASYGTHRYRLERAVELERVRSRLANDLHDDIGATLSQITLLSEVARRALDSDQKWKEPVARIGDLSRELTDSMSDLVWSINPRRDSLMDLTYRMRRFANDVCSASDIHLSFDTSGFRREIKLAPEARRHVYLIFKEGVNNVVRHASCTRTSIAIAINHEILVLTISDNGIGATNRGNGNGILSMQARATQLGGTLTLVAEPGSGTTVTLSAPIGKSLPKQVG